MSIYLVEPNTCEYLLVVRKLLLEHVQRQIIQADSLIMLVGNIGIIGKSIFKIMIIYPLLGIDTSHVADAFQLFIGFFLCFFSFRSSPKFSVISLAKVMTKQGS